MSSQTPSLTPLALLILALAAGTSSIVANVTFLNGYAGTAVEANSATELAYQSDASNSDLINGVTPSSFTTSPTFPTVGAWNTANGATVPELNDGIHGLSYTAASNSVQGAWPNRLATVTFTLGLGVNNLGYDISSIQSFAAWNGAGFGNQAWTLAVQPAGGGSFVDVATVDYQPLGTGGTTPGATKVTLSNLNITGIQALRLTTISVNGGNNGGAFVWRELDAVGISTPSASDTTPPVVSTLSPADGSGNVAVGGNLVVTFNEPVITGTGNITIKNLDAVSEISIPVGDGQISVVGAIMTINPSLNLLPGTNYAVGIDATAIDDAAGNSFTGIADVTTWNFTTAPVDTTNPSIVSLNPADNVSGVLSNANLVITFDENVVLGTGDITIKDLDTPAQTVITLPDPRISVSGAVLTINPSTDLLSVTQYAVQIGATAIADTAGNSFAGIADDTTWNFTVSGEIFSATQFAYTDNVSATDLLHGLTPITTGWNTTNQASPLELTDGVHGGAFEAVPGDAVQGAWTTVGATATYQLGTSPSGAGYDITSIQSIADWVSVGFGNQAWTIEVKPVGGSYSTLATVNYQPLGSSAGGCTKVTLVNPAGVLATGIESIKIIANQVNGGANAGAFVWRELDVFGVPTNDQNLPTIVSLSPADDSSNASPSDNLVATFSENIALGTGNITIKNLDTPAQTSVITLPDARVTVSGAVLTINPNTDLSFGTHYAIQIDATAIDDSSGNSFVGISNDTFWDFTTGVPDLTPPSIVTLSPSDNATNVPLASDLVATFDENIALGNGTITIKNLDTSEQIIITLPDARVSVSGAVLTIDPSSSLSATTDYAVQITNGAITDLSNNFFGGIQNDTTWNFQTASVPLRIMCLGDSITAGYTDNPGWVNHPFEFGYRSGLYTLLTTAGYNFLFVGGSAEPWNNAFGDPSHSGTYTPPLDLRTLGQDGHRGYGGASASTLQTNIISWLNTDNPDIILLKIGTNSQDTNTVNTLVNTIVTTKPNARLIIAEIMPKYTYQAGIVTYNNYIRNTLVPNYQALGKKVTLVNQYAPFLTNPADLTTIDQSLFSNGINHPDNDGYDKMAQVWLNGIDALGLGPNTFSSWIAGYPSVGGQTGLDKDPDGDGIDNGAENYFGTNPGTFSQGFVAGAKSGNTFTFTHPLNATPASDLTATYRWSKDLATFIPGGSAFQGTTVSFSQVAPSGGFVTVTATVTGTPLDKLFVDVEVTQN